MLISNEWEKKWTERLQSVRFRIRWGFDSIHLWIIHLFELHIKTRLDVHSSNIWTSLRFMKYRSHRKFKFSLVIQVSSSDFRIVTILKYWWLKLRLSAHNIGERSSGSRSATCRLLCSAHRHNPASWIIIYTVSHRDVVCRRSSSDRGCSSTDCSGPFRQALARADATYC